MPLPDHISLYAFLGIWACSLALALSIWRALLIIKIVNARLGACLMRQHASLTGMQIVFSVILLIVYILVVRIKFRQRMDSGLIVPFVVTAEAMLVALLTDGVLRSHLGISDCGGGGGSVVETQVFYTFCAMTVGVIVYVMIREDSR
jgi:hypothetical protein